VLNIVRYGVAWGLSVRPLPAMKQLFPLQRKNRLDKSIASYQLVQERLVNMVVEITKAQLLSYHLGRLIDKGQLGMPRSLLRR
jgi:glutaryl-CoA dehydrogenase